MTTTVIGVFEPDSVRKVTQDLMNAGFGDRDIDVIEGEEREIVSEIVGRGYDEVDAKGFAKAVKRGKKLLADLWDRLHFPILAQIGQQEQQPCKTLLAGIEELVYQVFLDAHVSRKQKLREHFRECLILAEHSRHRTFLHSDDVRFTRGDSSRHMQWLASETSLAKEISLPKDCDHPLLALVRNNLQLNLSVIDVKYRVGGISLPKNGIAGLMMLGRSPIAQVVEQSVSAVLPFHSLGRHVRGSS